MKRSPPAASRTRRSAGPFLGLDPQRAGLSAPLSEDIALLDRLLGRVLEGHAGRELLDIARRLYAEPDGADPRNLMQRVPELKDPRVATRVLRAYTMLFQLLNTAEQKEIVRVNTERQARAGAAARIGSIAEAVESLAKAGCTPARMQRLIDGLEVCPTLTAHPTEARRRAVLDKLQGIAHALLERGLPAEAPRLAGPLTAREAADGELLRLASMFWQTDELRASAPSVADEVANTLYFFERAIFDVVSWLHADLRRALERAWPGHAFRLRSFVRYRSWVGGDRDGNANVTPDVTWATLRRHKARVLAHYLDRVERLRREFTQSERLARVSPELRKSLEADRRLVSLPAAEAKRHGAEPYALKLAYMQARLRSSAEQLEALDDFRAQGAAFAPRSPAYEHAQQFVEDIKVMQESLRANRAAALADEGALADLAAQAEAFGFHLATLDVRQHSEEHERAVAAMFEAAGVLPKGRSYASLSEAAKVRLLGRELRNPRPLLAHDWNGCAGAADVLEVFEVVLHAQRYLSREAVSAYVISMTHGVSDVLEVLLLAKEVGLARWRLGRGGPRLESDIDIVPLFETIDDLARCDGLMRQLFSERAYRAQLKARGEFQEIMLGYSDSSKDGGFLAANWALHDTQAKLARVCRRAKVAVRFFHGRGGTVGRGGGRANRAILAQPAASFSGRIRFTEQGEVISFRYGLPPLGHRHMEQIVSAALSAAGAPPAQGRIPRAWQAAMAHMAEHALGVYRALVHEDPEFWTFYAQASPIHYISRLPIASRPATRSRTLAGLEGLRAIPWVFAWTQNRYAVPGWYGIGAALEAYAGKSPRAPATLARMYREWLFFRMVVNNAELELMRSDLSTAAWYAKRVVPAKLGSRVHACIAAEHARSREWILRVTGQDELLDDAPVLRRTVALRNPAGRPLSMLQIALLDCLDREGAHDSQSAAAWQEAMLLSITGIAAAMQSTG